MNSIQRFLLVAAFCAAALMPSAEAQPGGGPGGGGGGPGDPPRDTPGLDPVTLSGIAAAGYAGYRYLKFRPPGSKDEKE